MPFRAASKWFYKSSIGSGMRAAAVHGKPCKATPESSVSTPEASIDEQSFGKSKYEHPKAVGYSEPLPGSGVALSGGLVCAGHHKEDECRIGFDQSAGQVL